MEQKAILEEIISNIHIDIPDSRILNELLYTAEETGMIESISINDVETVVKIFHLANMYDNDNRPVPNELRM